MRRPLGEKKLPPLPPSNSPQSPHSSPQPSSHILPSSSSDPLSKTRTQTFPPSKDKESSAVRKEEILKKGWLQKLGNLGWKGLWCELTNSTLYYYKSPMDLNPIGEIILGGVGALVEEDKVVKDKQNVIHIAQGKKHYCFSAPSKLDMQDWISSCYSVSSGKPRNSLCPTCQNSITPEMRVNIHFYSFQ